MTILQAVDELLHGRRPAVVFCGAAVTEALRPGMLVFPGSFHPLHYGHLRLSYAATCLTGLPTAFEISVVNADKGQLTADDIVQRLTQFQPTATVILTRAPLFIDKARLLPGHTFLLGFDTAQRLLDPRYYGSVQRRDTALAEFRRLRSRFLVAGRRTAERFATLSDLTLPAEFRSMFGSIATAIFAADVSSTALRAAAGTGRPGSAML